jgi:hypothetical protein
MDFRHTGIFINQFGLPNFRSLRGPVYVLFGWCGNSRWEAPVMMQFHMLADWILFTTRYVRRITTALDMYEHLAPTGHDHMFE